MKTKIIVLSLLISALTFTVASTESNKTPKKKQASVESRVGKGLAAEDRNQFN